MKYVDAWVDALVADEQKRSFRDLHSVKREWKLAGAHLLQGFTDVRAGHFDVLLVSDGVQGPVLARYLRPWTQNFWLRVE